MAGQKPKPRLLTVSPVLRFVNVTVTKFLILRKLVIEPSGSAMLPDGETISAVIGFHHEVRCASIRKPSSPAIA